MSTNPSANDDVLELDPNTIPSPAIRAEVIFVQWHYDSEAGVEIPEARDYAHRLTVRLEEAGLHFEDANIPSYPRPPNPLDLEFWTLASPPEFDAAHFAEETREYVEQNNPWERSDG